MIGDTFIVTGGKQKSYCYEISHYVPARPSDKGNLEDKVELWKVKNIRRWQVDNDEYIREEKMSTSNDFSVWSSSL